MLSRSKAKRAVMAAVVAAAVGASGAATADAATVTRTDDTAADFTAGTPNGTIVRGTDAAAGVEIAPTIESVFNGAGPDLPTGWTATPWAAGGAATVGAGTLTVDGARVNTDATAGPGARSSSPPTSALQPFRHVGFGRQLRHGPLGDLQHRRRRAGARAVGQGVRRRGRRARGRHQRLADAADRHSRLPDRLVGDRLHLLPRRCAGRDPGVRARRPAAGRRERLQPAAPVVSRSTPPRSARGRPARSCHASSTRVIRR